MLEETRLVDSTGHADKLMKQIFIATGKALQKAASEAGQHDDAERAERPIVPHPRYLQRSDSSERCERKRPMATTLA